MATSITPILKEQFLQDVGKLEVERPWTAKA